jgi:hypothetical protein
VQKILHTKKVEAKIPLQNKWGVARTLGLFCEKAVDKECNKPGFSYKKPGLASDPKGI